MPALARIVTSAKPISGSTFAPVSGNPLAPHPCPCGDGEVNVPDGEVADELGGDVAIGDVPTRTIIAEDRFAYAELVIAATPNWTSRSAGTFRIVNVVVSAGTAASWIPSSRTSRYNADGSVAFLGWWLPGQFDAVLPR
jgi:hypothetical protein